MKLGRRLFLGGGLATLGNAALGKSYLRKIGAVEPVLSRGPALISADAETYGARAKDQIPSIAWVGDRCFMASYGGILPYAAESGEDAGCYGHLQYTDDTVVGSSMTWLPKRFWLWDVDTNSVQQPMVAATTDQQLIFAYVFGGTGGFARTIRAQILTNPLADPSAWVWGRDVFIGAGFCGPIRYIRGKLYFTAYEASPGQAPALSYEGNKLTLLSRFENILVPTEVSKITPPTSTEVDYYETSIVELSSGALQAMFRTEGRQFVSNSLDGGLTWGPATAFTLLDTVSSRVDRINLPNGTIAMAYNESLTKREKMTLAILSGDGNTVLGKVVIDSRGAAAPHPSYPFLALRSADPDHVYCAWDCGRGNQDIAETNELIFARINIADAMTSTLTMTSHTMTS